MSSAVVLAFAFLFASTPASPTVERLELAVTDVEDLPVDGLLIGLAGPEPTSRTSGGGVMLDLPKGTRPGQKVRLQVHAGKWVLISPWNGEVQVPAPGAGPVTVVVGQRGTKQLLASGNALHAIAQHLLAKLVEAQRSGEQLSDAKRQKVLAEKAAEYGLDPVEVDRALRAWREAPIPLEDKKLANRYAEAFPAITVSGGGIAIIGSEMHDPVIVTNPTGSPITINKAQPKFVLEGQLDQLSLGAQMTFAVRATPADALENARCEWSFEPSGLLLTTAAGDGCRMEVVMPPAPVAQRPSQIPARVSVRILREGAVLDELTARGFLHNGIAIQSALSAQSLAPGESVDVKIVPTGAARLPAGFTCRWEDDGPLSFASATAGACEGQLVLKPEKDWSVADGIVYANSLRSLRAGVVTVRILFQGGLVDGGSTQVQIAYRDHRNAEDLSAKYMARFSAEPVDTDNDRSFVMAGLPPADELSEKDLELRLRFDHGRWSVYTAFIGNPPKVLDYDGVGGLIRVSYSSDGRTFDTMRVTSVYAEKARELASLRHIWVELGLSSGRTKRGPYRLPFDFAPAARAALMNEWKNMDEEERKRLGCEGYVIGRHWPLNAHHFLPIIDEVAVSREGGAWRTRRFDSRIEHMFDSKFARLTLPVGPDDYRTRIRFDGGREETFSCKRDLYSAHREFPGRYYTLKRTAGATSTGPDAIEIYVLHGMDWGVEIEQSAPAAEFLRISTDGRTFRTIRKSARDGFDIDNPDGNRLVLRFVAANGDEVEYSGTVDFEGVKMATLEQNIFDEGTLSCWSKASGAILCGIEKKRQADWTGGGYVTVAEAAPIVTSVSFGCKRDRLESKDTFDPERAHIDGVATSPLTFDVRPPCATVYARFTLINGRQTELMVAPVVSK